MCSKKYSFLLTLHTIPRENQSIVDVLSRLLAQSEEEDVPSMLKLKRFEDIGPEFSYEQLYALHWLNDALDTSRADRRTRRKMTRLFHAIAGHVLASDKPSEEVKRVVQFMVDRMPGA